jgi:hypothetical protein
VKLEDVTEWLRKFHFGERGSKQNLAHVFGSALIGGWALKRVPDSYNEQQREQMHRDSEAWTKTLLRAIAERNSAFFRDLADGLDALQENAPASSLDPSLTHCCPK